MPRSTLTASLLLSILSASLGNAETSVPRSSRFAAGISVGTPALINAVAQYSAGRSALRISGMYYGDLGGAQFSAIPYYFSAHGINLGASLGGGYSTLRHEVGPFATDQRDEVSYLSGGLSLAWRGAYFEPAAWWGRNTGSSSRGFLIQAGYLFAID
jgi:hypothetical protein